MVALVGRMVKVLESTRAGLRGPLGSLLPDGPVIPVASLGGGCRCNAGAYRDTDQVEMGTSHVSLVSCFFQAVDTQA